MLRRRSYLSEGRKPKKFKDTDHPQKLADLNKYIAQKGYPDYRFFRGKGVGYYYVGLTKDNRPGKYGNPISDWGYSSIYTYSVKQLPFKEWLIRFIDLAKGGMEWQGKKWPGK